MFLQTIEKNELSPPPIFLKFKQNTLEQQIYRKDTIVSLYEDEMNQVQNNYHHLQNKELLHDKIFHLNQQFQSLFKVIQNFVECQEHLGMPFIRDNEFRANFAFQFQNLIKEFIKLKQDLSQLSSDNKKSKKRKSKVLSQKKEDINSQYDIKNKIKTLPDIQEIGQMNLDLSELSQEFQSKKVKSDSLDTKIVIKKYNTNYEIL